MNENFASIAGNDEKYLRAICERFGRRIDILEIGVGASTRIFKDYGTITSVDIDIERLNHFVPDLSINIDSLEFKPTKQYDLIFIDGNHTYRYVKNDLDNLYPFVKDGGYLAGHDLDSLSFDDKCIGEDTVGGVHHGVTKAVVEKFPTVETFHKSCMWCVKK